MSKKISLVILALALVLALVIPSNTVYAANKKVKSADVVQSNGTLTVSGEVEEGMLAVAVQVLDSNGNLITLRTGAVDSDNKYKVEIAIAEGDYTIKVADYDGGAVYKDGETEDDATENNTNTSDSDDSSSVTVTTNNEKDNPKTGDNILRVVTVLAIAVLGVFITTKFNKKKNIRARKH